MSLLKHILLVDDSQRDTELALEALTEYSLSHRIVTLRDGAEALDYLYRRGAFASSTHGHPAVVLLDLKLPKVDGLEVLSQIKSDQQLKSIPVVVLTSSREEKDIIESYRLGVNSYVVKPLIFDEFSKAMKLIGYFWAELNEPPPANASKRGKAGNFN